MTDREISDKEIKIRCLEIAKESSVLDTDSILNSAMLFWDFCCTVCYSPAPTNDLKQT